MSDNDPSSSTRTGQDTRVDDKLPNADVERLGEGSRDAGDQPIVVSVPPPLDSDQQAKERMEASSSERTRSIKDARAASLRSTETYPSSTSISYPPSTFTQPQNTNAPPRPQFDHSLLYPSYPRQGLVTGLKRLSYILSILLGSSAIIGLFWSTFILPLLHSTFSARQVILEQQVPRFGKLLDGLKSLRTSSIYPPQPSAIDGLEKGEDGKELIKSEHQSGIEEIRSNASSSSKRHTEEEGGKFEVKHHNPLPLDPLSNLTTSLKELSGAISSTSTTRTSLLSTLETYTSHLHREVYLRTDSKSPFSVGLGSLSQNLAATGGGYGSVAKDTEWDEVRKEVRAIKGLLLGRRNFVQP